MIKGIKSQLFICYLKKGALTGLSIANPNFVEIAFYVGYLHNVGSLEFSFHAIAELVCSRCMETYIGDLKFQ